MSLYDYKQSLRLSDEDWPFYTLIMSAMRQADTHNAIRLKSVFPDTWKELQKRYCAPGGFLPGEQETIE